MRRPTTRSGGSRFAERNSTGTSLVLRSWRQRLTPSTLGIITSSVTRSGLNSSKVSSACRESLTTLTV
jgi:hypothetical protein